jgi:hypothetical protein
MTTTTHSRPGRRDFLKATTGAVALGLTVGAPHVARAQQKVICRIGHSEAIGSPLTDAFEKWAKLLNEKSGGRIEAQHFPASQLGSYTQNIEQNRLRPSHRKGRPSHRKGGRGFRIGENGAPLPVECYFVPKAARRTLFRARSCRVHHACGY